MQADKDDAPRHLRNRSHKRWLLPAILGVSSIVWTALFIFAEPISIGLERWQQHIPGSVQDRTAQQRLEAARAHALAELERQQGTPAPQPAPGMHTYRAAAPSAEPAPRQTEFNEHNYRPRTDINTIPGVRMDMVSEPRRQKPRVRRGPEYWEWHSSGSREAGYFSWDELDGRIEWDSVCDNERYGSFRYRDCRKGAKVAFAKLCSRYQPACMAENHYRPL